MGSCVCCCCSDDERDSSRGAARSNYTTGGSSAWGGRTGGGDSGNRTRRNHNSNQSFMSQRGSETSSHPGANGMCVCRTCGLHIDPALIDGHKEICALNYRGEGNSMKAAQPRQQHEDITDIDGRSEDEICIVCLERLRCYAFLPCGHIACCGECAKQLETCPLCRQSRQGLCYVPVDVLSRYQCKHCHELIAPTLFDGHREVCGLRMRQVQLEREGRERHAAREGSDSTAGVAGAAVEGGTPASGPAAAADGSGQPGSDLGATIKPAATNPVTGVRPPSTPPTLCSPVLLPVSVNTGASPCQSPHRGVQRPKQRILTVCVECGGTDPRLVICIPCGHRVMCIACARGRSTCPVCLSEIKHVLNTFE